MATVWVLVLSFQTIFFDFDRYSIRPTSRHSEENRQLLLQHPGIRILIEGHCDNRGSAEHNLKLGKERAEAVKQALVQAGVKPVRIDTASLGKETPVCFEPTEECSQRNRWAQFVGREIESAELRSLQ